MRLFYACAAGDPVNAKSLIDGKADVNYKDHNGRTALHSVFGMASMSCLAIGCLLVLGLCVNECGRSGWLVCALNLRCVHARQLVPKRPRGR